MFSGSAACLVALCPELAMSNQVDRSTLSYVCSMSRYFLRSSKVEMPSSFNLSS
jgi:hypothetical protein